MGEIFLDVIGFNGDYQVSNLGNIKSKRFNKEIILKQKVSKKLGYCVVGLNKDKKKYTFFVHRLVAQQFLPNPQNKQTVNHKNKIKTDNNVINLEWNTTQENTRHSVNFGLDIKCVNNVWLPRKSLLFSNEIIPIIKKLVPLNQ